MSRTWETQQHLPMLLFACESLDLPEPSPAPSFELLVISPIAPPRSYALIIRRHTPSADPTCNPTQHSSIHLYIAPFSLVLSLSAFSITASHHLQSPIHDPAMPRPASVNERTGSLRVTHLPRQHPDVINICRTRAPWWPDPKQPRLALYKIIMRKALVFVLPV